MMQKTLYLSPHKIAAALLAVGYFILTAAHASVSVDIDLQEQRAYLLKNGRVFSETTISSGRHGHLTRAGTFKVTQMNLHHYSSLYGKIVDRNGDVVVQDADSAMPLQPGWKFVAAPMKYFIRFDGAIGMHSGYLPGYPASHGCVRLPSQEARLFYETLKVGDVVRVYGRTPTRPARERAQFRDAEREYDPQQRPTRRTRSSFRRRY